MPFIDDGEKQKVCSLIEDSDMTFNLVLFDLKHGDMSTCRQDT